MSDFPASVLPKRYDLCEEGFVAPPKQQRYGNCWSYACCAAVETFLAKQGMLSGDDDPLRELSEGHATYAALDFDHQNKNPYGKTAKPDDLGSTSVATKAFLTRGMAGGVVASVDDPVVPPVATAAGGACAEAAVRERSLRNTVYPPMRSRPLDITLEKERQLYVDGLYAPGDPDGALVPDLPFIEKLKRAVYTYGAVSIGFVYEDRFLDFDASVTPWIVTYWNPEGRGTKTEGTHAVAIVGWDDDFPRERFKTVGSEAHPKRNGAFKIKDSNIRVSAGIVERDGFFWMSYEDRSICKPFCVTSVRRDFFETPRRIAHHDIFGAMVSLSSARAGARPQARVVFEAAASEQLEAVGLYTFAPCFASAGVRIGEGGFQELFSDSFLGYAGYHTVWLDAPCLLEEGHFDIRVTLRAYDQYAVRLALESDKDAERYGNISVEAGRCFVYDAMRKAEVDVVDLRQGGNSFGYAPIRAVISDVSPEAQAAARARAALAQPSASGSWLHGLPASLEGAAISWRIEPYRIETYGGEAPSVVPYTVGEGGGAAVGFVNRADRALSARVSAVIGSGARTLRRGFTVSFAAFSPDALDCSCTAVEKGENTTTVRGSGAVPGALVEVNAFAGKGDEALAAASTCRVAADGTWEISGFELYPAKTGWKDEFSTMTVSASMMSNEGYAMATASQRLAVPRPYDQSGTDLIAFTFTGLLAACAVAAGAYKVCAGAGITCTSTIAGGAGLTVHGAAQAGGYTRLTATHGGSLFDEAMELRDLEVEHLKADGSAQAAGGAVGGLARTIADGGKVVNCRVRGVLEGMREVGGLFHQGGNVTVERCAVTCTLGASEVAAGIACSLDGGSVSCCLVDAAISAPRVAGAVSVLGGGARISDCRASVRAAGASLFGGIVCEQAGASAVERCLAASRFTDAAAGAAAYGISPGEEGYAAGVRSCVSVCSRLDGERVWRVCAAPCERSLSYDGMLVGATVQAVAGEELVSAARLRSVETYRALGFDTSAAWVWDERDLLLKLVLHAEEQGYDQPFPCPYPTKDGRFAFAQREMIAVTGAAPPFAEKVGWRGLSPADALGSPEALCRNGGFYFELAALPAGRYEVEIVAIAGEERHATPITMDVG